MSAPGTVMVSRFAAEETLMLLKSFSYAMIGVFAFSLVMTFAGSAKLLMSGGM